MEKYELTAYLDIMPLAAELCKSSLIPANFKTPQNALYAIMYGRELGLSPIYSLNNISVINGKTGLSADALLAIAMANPEYFGSEVDATDTYCTFTIKRKKSNGVIDSRTVTFTLQQAEKAGLLAKEGSNYKKYPMRMLKARAQAYACRDLFSDVIANIYTPEELEEVASPIKPDYSVEDVEQPKEPNKIVIAEKYNLIKNWLYHDIPLVSSLKEAYLLRANTALSEKNLDALETIIKELKTRLEDMKNAKRANKPALAVPEPEPEKAPVIETPPEVVPDPQGIALIAVVKAMESLLNSGGYAVTHAKHSIASHLKIPEQENVSWQTMLYTSDVSADKLMEYARYLADAEEKLRKKSKKASQPPASPIPKSGLPFMNARENIMELMKDLPEAERTTIEDCLDAIKGEDPDSPEHQKLLSGVQQSADGAK